MPVHDDDWTYDPSEPGYSDESLRQSVEAIANDLKATFKATLTEELLQLQERQAQRDVLLAKMMGHLDRCQKAIDRLDQLQQRQTNLMRQMVVQITALSNRGK